MEDLAKLELANPHMFSDPPKEKKRGFQPTEFYKRRQVQESAEKLAIKVNAPLL